MLPGTLRKISGPVFDGCDNIQVVWVGDECIPDVKDYICGSARILPAKGITVGSQLLWDLRALSEVVIPEGIEKIGSHWFSSSGIESVLIPPSVREIQIGAFCDCTRLKKVTFKISESEEGNRLERVCRDAFCGCDSLESVEFPATLRTIAQGAFAKCESLKTVSLNEGLEVLGTDEYLRNGATYKGVFQESGLECIKLPSTLRRIEYGAFKSCMGLKKALLPTGLEAIGEDCFWSSGLEEITIPQSVRQIGARAFSYCKQLKNV